MSTNAGSDSAGPTTQVAIVTGGGRGLGRAFAQALSAAGAAVAVTARTEAQLQETVRLIADAGGTALAFAADVTDQPAMERVVAEVERRLGPVDVLVNNAAVITPIGFDWEVDPDDWWRTFEINLRGTYVCTRSVLPGMMARRQGRIVNVSSSAAHGVNPLWSAYCASKAAVTHWTNQLAVALKEHGIHVFVLSPGGPTAMLETLATAPNVPEPVRALYRQAFDEGAGQIESSARMLLFLLSGQADALTGRHLRFSLSPDELIRRTDEIVRDDLYTLRLRV
jgi:NAD(P)-dependent dehydrogenase (short-subunit alcohol dehydrogenase family)